MTTAIVLFTRDLRVHDHPALAAACREADRVVPLFVFDDAILRSRYAAPNRVSALLDSVRDLRRSLQQRGGDLIIRRGDPVEQVHDLAVEVAADQLHLSADVSAYADRREQRLRTLARGPLGGRLAVHVHPGIVQIPPDDLSPSGGDHFKVFSPYWRRWVAADHRAPEPAPSRVSTPPLTPTLTSTSTSASTATSTSTSASTSTRAPDDPPLAGALPALEELTDGPTAPGLPPAGETAARERADLWFDGPIDAYDDTRNHLAEDGTSRLSPHLHLGTISVAELVARVDRTRPGQEAFLQELCWRDFNHQLLAARPDLTHADVRTQGDAWRDEQDAVEAWQDGLTGYPVVDAGMRQLRHDGWMHNRARMIVASFLTKHLYVDWRVGAWHFMDHLVDGDLANNFGQWQWTAGTGTDSRPNRMFNPVTQGQRHDPDGSYVRAYVPELAEVDDAHIHAPWEADDTLLRAASDYPPPIVDHREARERFLTARGA